MLECANIAALVQCFTWENNNRPEFSFGEESTSNSFLAETFAVKHISGLEQDLNSSD